MEKKFIKKFSELESIIEFDKVVNLQEVRDLKKEIEEILPKINIKYFKVYQKFLNRNNKYSQQ
jgi:hypothetical protein